MKEGEIFSRIGGGDYTNCWEWSGAHTAAGYGLVRWRGEQIYTHRFAWEYYRGEIPDGLHIDHLCFNRGCVNPWHLEPVPLGVNTRRRPGAHLDETRIHLTHCINGHEYDEANTYVSPKGWTGCRTCRREARRRCDARKAELV